MLRERSMLRIKCLRLRLRRSLRIRIFKKKEEKEITLPSSFFVSALIRSGSSGNHAVRASACCTITSGSSGYYRIFFLRFLRFGLR